MSVRDRLVDLLEANRLECEDCKGYDPGDLADEIIDAGLAFDDLVTFEFALRTVGGVVLEPHFTSPADAQRALEAHRHEGAPLGVYIVTRTVTEWEVV